jgi:hypothetical protein
MLLSIVSERSRSQLCGKGEVKHRIWICDPCVPKILICSKHDHVLAGSLCEPAMLCCALS